MTQLEKAALVYVNRKNRRTHPDGNFDKAGRWYPETYCDCCRKIREPSRAFPYSLMTHCRTMAHVANEYGVELHDLKTALKRG